jgi:phosphoserine phosphatase RsbU/P
MRTLVETGLGHVNTGEFDLAVLDALIYQVAVIDLQGTIIATNRAWNEFCLENGGTLQHCGPGVNYFQAANQGTVQGIVEVLSGKIDKYREEYPCHAPHEMRWFIMTVTPYKKNQDSDQIDGAVVIHLNNTDRKVLALAHEKEIGLARQLQRSVLVPPLKNIDIEIEGVYLPSHQLSGDMYAWYQINDNQYGIILLDIVGHGITSSLISMSVRSLLEGIIKRASNPIDVYLELNKHFNQLFHSKVKYCTGIYLLIDTNEKSVHYFNAGSPNGLVFGMNGQAVVLNVKTVPIGLVEHPNIQVGSINYNSGDMIFLYTDGIADTLELRPSECEDLLKREEMIRLHRMHPEHFVKGILAGAEQADDVTVVSVRL